MKRGCLYLALLVMMVSCVSCQRESVAMPGRQTDSNPDSAALAYMIAQETWCSNDQACQMLLHLIDGEDRYTGFDARYQALASHGVAMLDWELKADEPVTKGTAAFMLCRALGIEESVMFQLLPIRRYAYRQAISERLMAGGADFEPLTGPEAVGIFSRAARYQKYTQWVR